MTQTVAITSNWQIHIPKGIRETLGWGDRISQATLRISKDEIVIRPVKSKILAKAGILKNAKPKKKINVDKLRDYVEYGS